MRHSLRFMMLKGSLYCKQTQSCQGELYTVTLNLILVACFLCFSRPHSTDSATHRKMTLSLADRCSKTQKIRILPMAGRDPESHRNEMIKVTHFSHPCYLCCCVCLSSALPENTFVSPGTEKGQMRLVVDKRHVCLHKDIT